MNSFWFEFRCFLADFMFFVRHNFFNIFKLRKMEYLKNQKIRFIDVRGDANTGVIKDVVSYNNKIYYKVLVYDFIYEITEKEIIQILD